MIMCVHCVVLPFRSVSELRRKLVLVLDEFFAHHRCRPSNKMFNLRQAASLSFKRFEEPSKAKW